MSYENWVTQWKGTLESLTSIGGDTRELVVKDRAVEADLVEVEKKLGYRIPDSFRNVMLEFSSQVYMNWFLPNNYDLPGVFKSIFSGECSWNLSALIEINRDKNDCIEACFADIDDEYNKVWHNKLAFLEVGNGDYIAIDILESKRSPVVYLSHDGDTSNGLVLGESFYDYINKLTEIGCCGPEDWQMEPFIESRDKGFVSTCDNAQEIKRLLGIER